MQKKQEIDLLNQIKTIIVDITLQTLKDQEIVTEEIAFILFAYHFDSPFDPEVGLCKTSEKDYFQEMHGPLSAYGIGDMAYFNSDNNVYFYYNRATGFDKLINQMNEHVNKQYGYEEKKQFIIDAYIEICKELMKHQEIKTYIPTSEDFHIVAYDSGELNAEVYLEALLPKDQLEVLRKKIQIENDKPPYPAEDYELLKIYAEFSKEQIEQYANYKENVDNNSVNTLYSEQLLYFIEPYRLERDGKTLTQPIKCYDVLENTSSTSSYYQYKISNNKIVYISHYEKNKLLTETFFIYDSKVLTTEIKFRVHKSKRKLASYSQIDTSAPSCHKYICRCWEYNTNKLEEFIESDYQFNKKGLLTHCSSKELNWIHRFDARYDREFNYKIEHNNKGEITKISQEHFGENLTIYEADKSYIENNLLDVVKQATQYIMSELALEELKTIAALILPNAVLTGIEFEYCYVLIKEDDEYISYKATYDSVNAELYKSCHEFNTYANAAIDSAVYANNYLTKEEAELHMDRAYDLIAKNLVKEIKVCFKLDIPVFVGSYKLKTDAIIKIIDKANN